MIPIRRPRRAGSLAVAGAGLILAGCGGSHPAARSATTRSTISPHAGALRVQPPAPRPRTEISFSFLVPRNAGRHGSTQVGYSLSLTGPAGARCIGVDEAAGSAASAGARMTIVDGPRQTGRPWCAGRYTARVVELERAVCRSGQVCPQFIRVVGTVASATFSVRAS